MGFGYSDSAAQETVICSRRDPRLLNCEEHFFLVAERIHFNYTFWDNITHYKTKSVHFLGVMNSATEFCTMCNKQGKQAKINREVQTNKLARRGQANMGALIIK